MAQTQSILVTGGAGYVGSILVRRLLEQNYRVVCLDHLRFGGESLIDVWDHPGFVFHKVDITDFAAVDRVLDHETLHGVIHLAAIVGDPASKREPELTHRTNWDAPVHLLQRCLDQKVPRFIFASTCSNYGRMTAPDAYVDESSPLAPVSLYAELKVAFERHLLGMARRPDFCPTALRFATVYGLSHRMRFDLTVNEFTKELALGKELVVFGEQFWRPYCHVADFSRAMLAVLRAPAERVAHDVFNVGRSDENYTKGMLLDLLLGQFPQARIRRVATKDDPRDYRVRFDKIRERLGFDLSRTVPDGIREVKQVVELGVITDPEAARYYNIPHTP
ncbi:MAG: NAD(P)-dependent oxidoreductase [Magnetococcales bacterium]|nr:NAD(P)-dependent oxidoreductase [Magnetococcales bacterium]